MPPRFPLGVECLESRLLLSGSPLPTPVLETTLGNTLNLASPAVVSGNIGSGPAGAADVDWYSFTLSQASRVTLSASPQSGQAAPVVSLYNNDPNDFNDQYDPLGHRLLAQAEGGPGAPTGLTQDLAAGTYFVAISGAGNRYFHPFLAHSGYPGSTGAYSLQVSAANLGINAGDGPVVLDTTPAMGQDLAASPLVVRVDLSGSLDPNTVIAGQTVRLLESPTGGFGAGSTDVPLSGVSYSDGIAELQILPAQALAPGYYEIVLAGNSSGGAVLTDPSGTPLGKDAAHQSGQDYTAVFQVTGVDGMPGASTSDDTAATAHDLGSVAGAGLVQVAGSIGSDPAYSFSSTDPNLANPDAQVNLYKFEVSGPGRYALTAEAFAGRIGSPLDPGLSLFSVDQSGHLNLVTANDNTLNSSQAIDGSQPLFFDPALFSGLTQGTYYLAVSGTGNVPDPTQGLAPGVNGVFDPNNGSHSGQNGFTSGDYVLNLAVQASTTTPQVTGVSVRTDADVGASTGTPAAGAQLGGPPTVFDVQFNEPVNLQQLAYQAYLQNPAETLGAVYVTVPPTAQNANVQTFHARLLSYDPVTGLAQFLMLDAVPNGPYAQGQTPALHLSGAGPDGITDVAGNPLAGGGEVVVPFTVSGPPRGTGTNPLHWTEQEPNNSLASAQPLGVLFPNELQSGVVLQRSLSPTASDTADYYSFSVLESQNYLLRITGTGLPAASFAIYSVAQQQWITGTQVGGGGRAFWYSLDPGQYILKVGSWSVAAAPSVSYQLSLGLFGSGPGPQPLTVGPEPVIRLATAQAPNPPPPTPTPPAPPTPAPTPPPQTPPTLTPALADASPDDRFVVNAYLDLLQRGVDSGALSDKESRLGAGTSTRDIAVEMETSVEYSTAFVQGLYRSLLHRSGSQDEVNGWVRALNAGSTWARVEAAFLGSAEYYATRGGGNDADFLTALYEDVLGRAPDAGGLATWGAALAGGMSRERVAALILGSQEADQILVAGWYQTYLHRQTDAGGLAAWVGMLQAGESQEKVLADILGSQEYFARQ
jgi:hypothetical protein